ncbi:hypothetical protein ACFXPS_28920 [Nocardia sp. NPDC059091]|uniref:hypothetical protein n=1 Tax=unclassified Nocardia TaxID=2637762 RepID=UPI00367915EA
MSVESIAPVPAEGPGDGMLHYRDAESGHTFLIGPPQASPALWRQCMDGALEVYRHYSSEDALEYDAVVDGLSTTLFAVALDREQKVVAGVRAEGPHRHVDEVHAVSSWRGMAGDAAFRRLVAEQIPDGVIECKAGWTARDTGNRSALADWVARAIVHCATLLGVRYAVGVAPEHALKCYRSSGANVAWWIPPTSYPDDRYRTVPVWWDLHTYHTVATEPQARLIEIELAELVAEGTTLPDEWSRDEGLA